MQSMWKVEESDMTERSIELNSTLGRQILTIREAQEQGAGC